MTLQYCTCVCFHGAIAGGLNYGQRPQGIGGDAWCIVSCCYGVEKGYTDYEKQINQPNGIAQCALFFSLPLDLSSFTRLGCYNSSTSGQWPPPLGATVQPVHWKPQSGAPFSTGTPQLREKRRETKV